MSAVIITLMSAVISGQVEGGIFYEACKDIPQGTEMLVWYGDCYLQFMGIPVSLKEMADSAITEELECKIFQFHYNADIINSAMWTNECMGVNII